MGARLPVLPTLPVLLLLLLLPASGCKETSRRDPDPGFVGVKRIRPMRKAGTWYPRDPRVLGAELDRYLVAASTPALHGRLVGIISPHAGYSFSGATAAYGFKVLGRARGVRRVIVAGPSHHEPFLGISVPDVTHYATPFGLLRLGPAAAKLRGHAPFISLPAAHRREHSVEMQMVFLKRVRPKVQVVPMVVGRMSDARVAEAAARLAPLMDAHTVFLASSDFTHRGRNYGFEVQRRPGEALSDAVRRLDFGTLPFFRRLDAAGLRAYHRRTRITMCGREPVAVMLATFRRAGLHPRVQVLHYTTSGYVTGDWRSSVSYLSVAFVEPGKGSTP